MTRKGVSLPWRQLADQFYFEYRNSRNGDVTNLYPCYRTNQAHYIEHFTREFARIMDDAARNERATYPSDLSAPACDEIFIPDSTAGRIAKTVRRYKILAYSENDAQLSTEERTCAYWHSILAYNGAHSVLACYDADWHSADLSQLLQTLILHDEMEPLLRVAADKATDLQKIWCYVAETMRFTLQAYLCLNVLLVKPELHDADARSTAIKQMHERSKLSEERLDYRNTSCYHKVLVQCAWQVGSSYHIAPHTHQEFFGIETGQLDDFWGNSHTMERLGRVRPCELLGRTWHVPSAADVDEVGVFLLKKRLPAELVWEVLGFADYVPKRTTPVPDDPLHKDNRKELETYLDDCWKYLVRLDMLFKANGTWIDWPIEISRAIDKLWQSEHRPPMFIWEVPEESKSNWW